MANCEQPDPQDESTFQNLRKGVADLQSLACDLDFEKRDKPASIYDEECEKCKCDADEAETLKMMMQTTEVARLAIILINRGVQFAAVFASRKSKYFSSLSSAIAFLRGQEGPYQPPKHVLLEWERNMILMDLFSTNKGLYCSKRIAQDMFDICMETFDWLRSFSNNNK